MSKLFTALAALALSAGAALAADPAEGTWQTQVDDGNYAHVVMQPCGDKICGTMARTFNAEGEYASPHIGRTLVIDMVPQGDGTYKGSVWRPSNDKIYNGRMELAGDRLKLAGCVVGGLICASQTWARVK